MADSQLLLIGGGHAHVAVLADFIESDGGERATLLTPNKHLRYSGMVPGWIAGEYDRDKGVVDLEALAQRAGFDLILDRCTKIDPDRRRAFTETGLEITFDIASIDTGGVGRAASVLGNDPRIIDVRPIDDFVARLNSVPKDATGRSRIAVIGGGAGGVELAFALRQSQRLGATPDVTMIAGNAGLLPQSAAAVSNRVRTEMGRQSIRLIEADPAIENGKLLAGDALLEPVDLIIAALGSAAPRWPGESGLACDQAGFIAVDRYQRSTSHPHIFAAGDVASRTDCNIPHSGVHAVHTGPVLAANLRAVLADEEPKQSYVPRPASLYLLSTGNNSAILSYGPLAMQGRWVARLKRWIDKRWIAKYAKLGRQA